MTNSNRQVSTSIFRAKQLSQQVRVTSLALLTTATGFASIPALAQQAPTLEEIVVTATRREESLQTIPLAVTAFDSESLRTMGIVDIKGITERTPGFTMGQFNPGQTQLYIRGIGSNEDGAGGDQSVIVFIDEVYIGRAAGMDVDLFDLERAEVLRGPQGTLFGKNVVGGAVNLITKKPTEEPEFRMEATVGNLNAKTFRGLASGPIADNVFGKISFSSRRRDGYLESRIGDFPEFFPSNSAQQLDVEDALNVNKDSLRGQLRFTPSDALEVNLTASFASTDLNGQPEHFIGPAGIMYAASAALIPNYDDDIYASLYDNPGYHKNDTSAVALRFDYAINDDILFTSLTSHREVDAENSDWIGGESDGLNLLLLSTPIPFLVVGTNDYIDDSKAFTQEFRLTSTGDGPLQWVAGLYYLQEKTHRNESVVAGIIASDGAGGFVTVNPTLPSSDDQNNTTDSYAVFGQATWAFSDSLSLTLGARYTSEEKDIVRIGTAGSFSVTEDFFVDTDESWDELTGKASLEWQATDDAFFYLSYSRGFKSGGFQGLSPNGAAAGTPFDPEFADLYELGAKTEWFERRLRLNAAVFYTDYQDLQILQLLVPDGETLGSLYTQNASDAEITGLELEFTALPVQGLTIQGSYTFLDTEYQNFAAPPGFTAPGGVNIGSRDGNELRNAPENAYNLMVRYDWELASGGGLSLQGEFRHKDKVYQDPDVLEIAAVPAYDVFDARLAYTVPNGNFEFALWGKNLADEEYLLHNFPGVTGEGAGTPAPPRTYGVTVSWRNN